MVSGVVRMMRELVRQTSHKLPLGKRCQVRSFRLGSVDH